MPSYFISKAVSEDNNMTTSEQANDGTNESPASQDDQLSMADYDRKLDYLVDKYELDGIVGHVQTQWEKDSDDRWGVRACGKFINQSIVDTVLDNMIEQPPLATSEDIVDTLLADETDSEADNQTELRSWFRRHGVDPDELAEDLIHYRTVYNYLREIEDAESPSEIYDTEELRERAVTRGDRAKTRVRNNIQDRLAFLERNEVISHSEYNVIVQLTVQCNRCGRVLDWAEMVTDGCSCHTPNSET